MRMLAVGSDIAPTLPHFVWSLPPEGAAFCLGAARRQNMTTLLFATRNVRPPAAVGPRLGGFTLLELLLVVAIIATASAGVSFALRDSAQTQLEREGLRLAALLESARSRSLASGVAVRWRTTDSGFVFDGLPAATLPEGWLSADVTTATPARLLLGPEPILAAQNVQLVSRSQSARSLTVGTDGLRPFVILPAEGPNGPPPRAP
jgi:general secretion pathway protein H